MDKQSKSVYPVLYLFSLIIIFLLLFFANRNSINVDKNFDNSKTDHGIIADTPKGKILIILLDSLPLKYAFSEYMPFINGLRCRSAWGKSKVISSPFSIAGDNAIFAGKISDFFSLFNDFKGSKINFDNYFSRIRHKNKRLLILSSYCLGGAYGQYGDKSAFEPKSFKFSEYLEDGKYLFENAYNVLKKEQWQVAVVQSIALDLIGHLETPKSKNYSNVLKKVDEYVQRLVSLTSENDIILITSEHGMDDNGFHTDTNSDVVDTAFLLSGPGIVAGGPHEILQIDLAPTLSILSGISHIYNSPAVPRLDFLVLSDARQEKILDGLAKAYSIDSKSITFEMIDHARQGKLNNKGKLGGKIFIFAVTCTAAILLSIIALSDTAFPHKIFFLPLGIFSIFFVLVLSNSHMGMLHDLSSIMPFSANFMMKNPILVFFILITAYLIGFIAARIFKTHIIKVRKIFLLVAYTISFGLAYNLNNPYHALNWLITITPLLAFGYSKKYSWFCIFISMGIGLLIRRLTFVNAYYPIIFPERWLFAVIAGLGCFGYLSRRNSGKQRPYNILLSGMIFFLPAFLAILLCDTIAIRAGLILFCFPLLIISSRIDSNSIDVWLVLWVVLFLIGTSTSIGHLTHLVLIPILLSVFYMVENITVFTKAVLLGMLMWILYFLPGNGFDLKLLDLTDKFIMSSANTQDIGYTIIVIICRYFLPAALFSVCLFYNSGRKSYSTSAASIVLLPVVLSIGTRFFLMETVEIKSIPWEYLSRIIVLSGFMVSLLSGQIVSLLLRGCISDNSEKNRYAKIRPITCQNSHF